MIRVPSCSVLVALLASVPLAHGVTVELAATGQFQVPDARVYRSVEPPARFLVVGSRFGRPVFITTGPLGARLLDPARVSPDAADPEIVRVDMGGPQQNFLSVRLNGENLVVDRDGIVLQLTASPPILGDRTLDELIEAMPEYRRGAARYSPDAAALEELRRTKQPAELLVFFGSWCSHCERVLPRLVRVLQDTRGAPIQATFHGVPPGGAKDALADELGIAGLPTAIVRRGGKEVARLQGPGWNAPETSLAALVGAR